MKFATALFLSLISLNVFAHGENKLGPNNGYIRMPGSFHTELVPDTDGNFMVYLLDVNNQNPAVKDSSVEFKMKDAEGSVTFKCLPMPDHFHCMNERKIKELKEASIIIKAKRLGVTGTDAVYKLPLTLATPVDHSKMKH